MYIIKDDYIVVILNDSDKSKIGKEKRLESVTFVVGYYFIEELQVPYL